MLKEAVTLALLITCISLLTSQYLKIRLEKVLNCGTKEWTGCRAVKSYIRKNSNMSDIKIVQQGKGMNDYYNMANKTLYLSSFAVYSYSLYSYTNALREAVSACEIEKHRIMHGLRSTLGMIFRFAGPLTWISFICYIAFKQESFITFAFIIMFIYIIYQLMNALYQKYISILTLRYTKDHDVLEDEALKVMKRYQHSLQISELSSFYQGTYLILKFIPKILVHVLNEKKKKIIDNQKAVI